MKNIYGGCFLNISAASSANSYDGFLEERRIDMKPLRVPTVNSNSSLYFFHFNQSWDILEHSQINTRGWALQERLLSPRVLQYCDNQMFWECSKEAKAECKILESPSSGPAAFKRIPHDTELPNGPSPFPTIYRSNFRYFGGTSKFKKYY